MSTFDRVLTTGQESSLASHKVVRNTYALLSMTLLFSALMASVSIAMGISPGASMIASIGAIALIWLVLPRTQNSAMGIVVVFGITGLLGLGLGPMLTHYLAIPGGSKLVGTALGGTGVIFLGLSAYALTTRRDFSFMGGFLFAGLIVVMMAMIANMFFAMPALQLTISAVMVMLMSALILFDTSRIVNGGETNYIRATVSLFLSLYNLFISLLQLLGVFGGGDD